MNSTGSIDNPSADMSAMQFRGYMPEKEMAPLRGAEPSSNRYRICQEGTQRAQGREEKHPLC